MSVLPITNGFYESQSLPISHQECTNWYVSQVQTQGALAEEVLFGTPGITQISTSGTYASRGAWVKNGIPYVVNGTTLYSIDRTLVDGVVTYTCNSLGTVEGTARVSMADNGTQLMVLVPGGKAYIYNEDEVTPFVEITDTDFDTNGNAQFVIYVDGYFLCTTDSKKFIISALNDGTSWGALDFGSAESDPDAIVAPVIVNNQVYIIGTQTTEGFQNLGGMGFPFQRTNVVLDKGCHAPYSVIRSNQTFYMIGGGKDESPAIWMFEGNIYRKVSTTSIEELLNNYTDSQLEGVYGMSYAQAGAFFVAWSLPDRTLVYEQLTKKWHERKSTILEVQSKWRVSSLVTAYGLVMVTDTMDGRVGQLSLDTYKEYDEDMVRIVTSQPFAIDGSETRVPQLELTMEAGVGNDDVEEPVVGLAISRDAKIFEYERLRRIGKIGEYGKRVIWRKNGRYPRYVVFRFRLSDAVKPVIIKLEAK